MGRPRFPGRHRHRVESAADSSPGCPESTFLVGAFTQATLLFDRAVLTMEISYENEDDFIHNLAASVPNYVARRLRRYLLGFGNRHLRGGSGGFTFAAARAAREKVGQKRKAPDRKVENPPGPSWCA